MTTLVELVEYPRLDAATQEGIVRPLAERATRADFAFAPNGIAIALKSGADIHGGLIASTYWDWMTIEILAVPEALRGMGYGRRLMALAEARAIERGCVGAWVDTYSFQSPGFYEAMGYQAFGRLPNYPKGESRIFYSKPFPENAVGAKGAR